MLAAAPTSARSARRFVAETLTEWELGEVGDTAELLVSELVTNVVLHAHTDIEVVARLFSSAVRIEVRDTSSVLPTMASHLRESQTGRGLELVETLSDSWGVEVHRDRQRIDGKGVWFELCFASPSAHAQSDDRAPAAGTAAHAATVCLQGVPTALYRASEEHRQGLVREFVLMTIDDPSPHDVPARLVVLSEELSQRYAGPSASVLDQVQAAERRGEATVDLLLELSPGAAAPLRALVELLEEADGFCAQGAMLTVAATAEIRAFRRWCVDEVEAQLLGHPATPWRRIG